MLRCDAVVCAWWVCLCAALPARADTYPGGTYFQKTRTFLSAQEFGQETGGRVPIRRTLDPQQQADLRLKVAQWPSTDFTVIAVEAPGVTWVGTRSGAIRLTENGAKCEYFAGRRWLPDDHVTGIGFEKNLTWVETPKGFSKIQYVPMLLPFKSQLFVAAVQTRHNRWGLTAESSLRVAGELSTNRMISSDNDGLWTAMYVAAECFRYKVTGQADARANARAGMQAILRLELITGIPGFPARSFIKVGQDVQPGDGEWHDTADKQWRWKGDTSSDEIVGHYFVYPIYHDLVADESEKPALCAAVDRITTHILDHNYRLVDVDGKGTTWGWWGPDAIWEDADETGLRALHILSHLRVAIHLTRDAKLRDKYQAAYDELVNRHKYALLTRNQKVMVPGLVNHSDDELAFLSYYPLLQYEKDPKLLAVYRESLWRSWQVERAERNPLWNFIYAAGTGAKEFDRAESLRTLREIPTDQVEWTMTNSHRRDVPLDPVADRHGGRQALFVLPYDELPVSRWNANPYELDGGNGGHSEGDGAYFLLPYWMGRYHRLVDE